MSNTNVKVYIIRHKETQDVKYAGLTQRSLFKRFQEHKMKRRISEKQYAIELVQDKLELMQAVKLEEMLIAHYNLLKTGWNKSPRSINGYSNAHSEEQKRLWSVKRKGRKLSEKHKHKLNRKGLKNSKEHNRRLSEFNSKPVMCLETGIIYKSARLAAKHLNLQYSKISLVCSGKRKTTGGYHFTFVPKTVDSNRND